MSNLNFKRMKKCFFQIFMLVALFFLIIFSCRQDFENQINQNQINQNSSAIEDAKLWYENNVPTKLTLKSAKLNQGKLDLTPAWEYAFAERHKCFTAVQVPLGMKGGINVVLPENKQAYLQTKDPRYLQSLTYLVIANKEKKRIGFSMTIVPDKSYLNTNNYNGVLSTYKKWQKNFSGYILYHSLTGDFINGWRFLDGKAIKSLNKKSYSHQESYDCQTVQSSSIDCYTLYTEILSRNCMEMFYYTATTPVTYNGVSCGSYYVDYVDEFEVCNYSFDDSTGYVTYNDSLSGGFGGVIPPDPVQPICSCNICPVCGGCLNDGLKSANISPSNCPEPCICPVVYNELTNNTKANCIYEKLISQGTLSSFTSRFLGLTEPNESFLGEIDLYWSIAEINSSAMAGIYPIGDPNNGKYNAVQIVLDGSETNTSSSTYVALAMLHEALHAKLIANYYDATGTTDFKSLYAHYKGLVNMDSAQSKSC